MPKFRFYITDITAGEIVGTDNEQVAKEHALSEDSFVVDTETGNWLMAGGHVQEVQQQTVFQGGDFAEG